jgi:regulator of CtrA degradation
VNDFVQQLNRANPQGYPGCMSKPDDLGPRIIESLYSEGLMLSDEVRTAFNLSDTSCRDPEDLSRIALSCEALRTTTRMMQAIAWLLNHRAFFRGEISEFQLRRHCRLQTDYPAGDPKRLELLPCEVRDLVETTERFHARLVRLDLHWRENPLERDPDVLTMQKRLGTIVH